jgi:ring-1,2-phenylacetyl-CoA epoxidase subunit PaaD
MVEEAVHTLTSAWNVLNDIPDPDIPVISVVELGLIRDVLFDQDTLVVKLTPSYNGCPAMYHFREEIPAKLQAAGFGKVRLEIVLSPAWTTDWLTDETKEKMRQHGIAPPDSRFMEGDQYQGKHVQCPWCKSQQTTMTSRFGSTPCKALWFCKDCSQPFEYFKCH